MTQVQRPDFYEGQILGSHDLKRTVEYSRDQDARHERYLHAWGLSYGLHLEEFQEEWFLSPGFAIDSAGAPIVVSQPILIAVNDLYDDALINEKTDDGKWFPMFIVRAESAGQPDTFLDRFGQTPPSRIDEGAAIRFRAFETDWDIQDPPTPKDGPGRPSPSRVVLLGFVQWKKSDDSKIKGTIADFRRRHPDTLAGPRYAGVKADDVLAQGGELTLRSQPPKQHLGSPGLILGDHRPEDDVNRKAMRLGLDDRSGRLNEILTVDPKGNLFVKGNIQAGGAIGGKLIKGDVAVESGMAADGMTLPLPPGIDPEAVARGDVVLHVTATPRLDSNVGLEKHEQNDSGNLFPIVRECSIDENRRVRCSLRWVSANNVSDGIDVPGSVDYLIVAYVNKSETGGAP